MEYFNLLPEEITLDIISRLPTESALGCKLVSTTWRSLVRNPSFSKMHLNHPAAASGKMGFIALTYIDERIGYNLQYFEYDENHKSIERIKRVKFNPMSKLFTRFLGSYNGLICYSSREKTCICNPITREYILLPEIKSVAGLAASGFGYVSSNNEYKVVRITYEFKTGFMEVHVYTLGSGNGWRNIGRFNFGTRVYWGQGVFVKGAIYWLDYHLKMIIPFDFAEEKFGKHISLPENDLSGYLGYSDGCLSFTSSRYVNEAECWYVWLLINQDDNNVMKEREGHQSMGWSEGFKVFENEEFGVFDSKIFAVTKSYDVLTYDDNHINVHDPETSTWKRIVDFKENFGVMFPHKNTLVSLKELGEEDTKIMESVEVEETESDAQPFQLAVGG